MVADFKSHVLRREEKGVAGVPFKRMLLGGVVGGMGYMVASFMIGGVSIPIGIITGIVKNIAVPILLIFIWIGKTPFIIIGCQNLKGHARGIVQ